MALMPTTPLSPMALFYKSIALYVKIFVRTLPYILIIIGFHFLLGTLKYLLKLPAASDLNVIFMGASILLLPLLGGFFNFQRAMLDTATPLMNAILSGLKQLVQLILAIIYISLVPVVLICLGVGGYLFLDPHKVAFGIRLGMLVGSLTLTCLLMANKIFSPVLVMTDNLDAASAQIQCAKLTKGFYVRSFFFGFLPMLLGIYLFWMPTILNWTLSDLKIPSAYLAYQAGGDALLGIIGPWLSLIILLYLNDLNLRKTDEFSKESRNKADIFKQAGLKSKSSTDGMI